MDAAMTRAWILAVAMAVERDRDRLTRLDSSIGDSDHGVNLHRGFTAVTGALDSMDAATPGEILAKTGTTLISKVGGASGPLYGSVFRTAGKLLTEPVASPDQVLAALRAGLAAVQRLGGAQPGDKTMVDAFVPALDAFDRDLSGGGDLASAAASAAQAAEAGAEATIPLQARKGRASYLGPRSVGHEDPGAASTALIFRALADVTAEVPGG
jgi:phosphoenolpyruvate---glycerone phosphotransferase subunit DhaL